MAVETYQGVEVQGSSDGHGNNEIGRGDERVSGRVGIVTAGEVTVVRGDDGVRLSLLYIFPVPLDLDLLVSVSRRVSKWPEGNARCHTRQVFHARVASGYTIRKPNSQKTTPAWSVLQDCRPLYYISWGNTAVVRSREHLGFFSRSLFRKT